jgi:hypothetical protein
MTDLDLKSLHFFGIIESAAVNGNKVMEGNRIDILHEYNRIGKDRVFAWSELSKLTPFIAHLFMELAIDSEFWNKIHDQYRNRNEVIISILVRVFQEFKVDGVEKVFCYENFGALLSSNGCLGCFASHDVDIYVNPEYREATCSAVQKLGFRAKKSNAQAETVKTEFDYEGDELRGFGINIMWVALSRTKLPFEIDIESKIDWGNIQRLDSTLISLPSHDLLLYLCLLHISVHSYSREPGPRLYKDIENLAKVETDWNRIVKWAKSDGTLTRVVAALTVAERLHILDLPNTIGNELQYDKRKIKSIEKIAFNFQSGRLDTKIGLWNVLRLEILSSDHGFLISLAEILFPKTIWIRKYYLLGSGWLFRGYLMHWKNLIFGFI